MKKLFLPILLLLLPVLLFAQDFRQVSWGMTIEEVARIEGYDYQHDVLKDMFGGLTDYLYYNRPLIGEPAHLTYGFHHGQLAFSWHSTRSDIYDRLLGALIAKYGKPAKGDNSDSLVDIMIWHTGITDIELMRYPETDNSTGFTWLSYSIKDEMMPDRTKEDAEQL